ncbi:MAG: flavodoxin domain-containing protein [Bacteroidales bacterium]|nr:flavodoxin domain-containing protein [Bacteroidales bacterium]
MKTAIIYYSKHGTTKRVAEMLESKLTVEKTFIDLQIHKSPNIEKYDSIILGSPVYAGTPSKIMKNFCMQNIDCLKSKPIGLYVCGMEKDELKQKEELERAYPIALIEIAKTKKFLGGEFLFENMNFFERMIVKKIAKTDKNVSAINYENLDKFVLEFNL